MPWPAKREQQYICPSAQHPVSSLQVSMVKSSVQKCSQKFLSAGSTCPPLEKDTLRIYSMRFCPYAQRVRCIIAHKDIPVEYVNLDLIKKPEWYKEKNPMELVPCMEQNDKILYESDILADYLDETYPTPRLGPTDPYQKARQKLIFQKYNKDCVDSYNCFFRGTPEMKEAAKPKLEAGLKWLDQKMKEHGMPFFSGDEVGLLDYLIWPHFERFPNLKIFLQWDLMAPGNFPSLEPWIERMKETPGVKATYNTTETHLAFGQGLASGAPPYDLGLEDDD